MRFFIIASPFWLAACGQPDIVVSAPPPPAEWLTCEQLPAKPNLDPLAVITLPDGRTAYAKPETDARDAASAEFYRYHGLWDRATKQLETVMHQRDRLAEALQNAMEYIPSTMQKSAIEALQSLNQPTEL